jgi:hypothetical protein
MVRALPLLLSGCMTFSRVQGAKTLEPGQMEAGLAMGVRTADDPSFPLPVPQGPLLLRVGVAPDLDLGFRGYLLGGGVDVRWRFAQEGNWHFAVNPGIGAVLQPSILNLTDLGALETTMPLVAEVELNRWLSWSVSTQATYRHRLNLAFDGAVWRFDLYAGGGTRLEASPGILVFGLYGDLLAVPTRHTGVPVYTAGLDLKLRTLSREEIEAKRKRRKERR